MSALLLTACYDDSEMKSRLDKMDQRLTTVESQVASLNTQLTKLQGLMDGKLFISNIEDKEDGTHVITFVDVYGGMSTMTLTDGQAPDISVKQTPDGKWYWTVNGEWLLDSNGNKVPVTGEQGVTPSMKSRTANGMCLMTTALHTSSAVRLQAMTEMRFSRMPS